MLKIILSLFVPFRRFIEMMNADFDQFILILKLKLTLDDRRITNFSKTKNANPKNMLVKQSITQIIMGLIFTMFLTIIKNPFTYFYFAHMLIMVMMGMMIISEFTTILFDTSENSIIQPLPIKGNTIGLARNAHIFIYLTLMAFNLSIASLIIAITKFGIVTGLIFIFTLILNVLFTLFLSNILYLGIMKVASGERLKNILMYFQVAIAILFMAGYQFGMNIIDKSAIQDMIVPVSWYTFLIPPAFYSGFIEAISTLNFDQQHIIFLAETIIIPVIAIYYTGKYLSPVFNKKLMELEQSDRTSKEKSEKNNSSLWFRIMRTLFTHNQTEKATFRIMWKMAGRERAFIQTLLPSIGYILIMILLPIFKKDFNFAELVKSDKYLLISYAFSILAATVPSALLVGKNKTEAWIFKSIPVYSPADYFKGTIKAAIARFLIPFYIIFGIIICILWGIHILPDVIISLQFIYLLTLLFHYYQPLNFPFSVEKAAIQGGTAFFRILLIMASAAALGFFHYFLLNHWFEHANLILIPFYACATIYLNKVMVYRKITWKNVDTVNDYI